MRREALSLSVLSIRLSPSDRQHDLSLQLSCPLHTSNHSSHYLKRIYWLCLTLFSGGLFTPHISSIRSLKTQSSSLETAYRNKPGSLRNASCLQVILSKLWRCSDRQVPGIPYVSEGKIIPSWVQPGQCQAAPVPVPMPIQAWPEQLSTQPQAGAETRLIPVRNQLIFWVDVKRTCTQPGNMQLLWPQLAFHRLSAGMTGHEQTSDCGLFLITSKELFLVRWFNKYQQYSCPWSQTVSN